MTALSSIQRDVRSRKTSFAGLCAELFSTLHPVPPFAIFDCNAPDFESQWFFELGGLWLGVSQ